LAQSDVAPETCALPCNLCGSKSVDVVATLDRDRKPLRTVICRDCGLVWSDPRPLDARSFYEHDYRVQFKGAFNPKPKHIHRGGIVAIDRYQKIRTYLGGRRALLDIGSGAGEFLYLMTKAGFKGIGIEPNLGYGGYSREQYGVEVLPGFAQDHEFAAGSFDTITMWHVLEHTEDPFGNIQLVKRWLAPGGLLVVEVPNVEATCLAPIHRFHIDHLYNFNRENLSVIGEKAGLHCAEVRLSHDNGNLTAFYLAKGDSPRADCRIPGNHARISAVLRAHTPIMHYTQVYPYRRLLGRIGRIVGEARAVRDFSGGRRCLDDLYSGIVRPG
jgi:2-polyprenyl-3-methyl-5-hydroxy-6-metoxy-1,4-benzoquinol methylase